MGLGRVGTMTVSLSAGRDLLGAVLLAMSVAPVTSAPRVRGIEATGTHVDVQLTFASGCAGSGILKIFDPEGRPFAETPDGEQSAPYRQPLTWTAGTEVKVSGAFNGAASPRLQLLDSEGKVLLAVNLVPWGGRPGRQDDVYTVFCDSPQYRALPDTAAAPTNSANRPLTALLGLLLIGTALALFAMRNTRARIAS
jgi:hypothetical protein